MEQIDENEIRSWWQTFHPNNDWVEVRIFGTGYKLKQHLSGYFNNVDKLIQAIKNVADYTTINVTFNEIKKGIEYRKQRDCLISIEPTTGDGDITKRRFILIDVDPERATGISATDEEKAHAKDVIETIKSCLDEQGFCQPIYYNSGNGYHLYYPLNPDEWENTPENTELVKDFLQCLDDRFTNDFASVDTGVYNASRVAKLVGTWARKGADTPERPHRMATSIEMQSSGYVAKSLVQSFVNDNKVVFADEPTVPTSKRYGNYGQSFDIDDFIREHHIGVYSDKTEKGRRKIVLDQCPFDSSHKHPDSAIFVEANGMIGFKCFHAHCAGYTWKDVRQYYEPDYNPVITPNFTQGTRRDVEYQTAKNSANSEVLAQVFSWDDFKKKVFDDEYYQRQFNKIGTGLETGYFIRLDTGKFPLLLPVGVSFITAISGHGKTAFMCNIILNILKAHPDKRIVYFVFEEAEEKIIARMANINLGYKCSVNEKNNQQMIEGYFSHNDTSLIADGQEGYVKQHIDEIKALRKEHRLIVIRQSEFEDTNDLMPVIDQIPTAFNNEVCAVFIDHLGKLYENPKKDRYMDIDTICGKLNNWGIDNNIPVVLAVQFNKGVKNITTMTAQNISDAWKITNNSNLTVALWNSAKNVTPDANDLEDLHLPSFKYGQSGKCVLKILKDKSGFIPEDTCQVLKMDADTKHIETNEDSNNLDNDNTFFVWQ